MNLIIQNINRDIWKANMDKKKLKSDTCNQYGDYVARHLQYFIINIKHEILAQKCGRIDEFRCFAPTL